MKKWRLLGLLLRQAPLCYAFQPEVGIVGLKDFQFDHVTTKDANVVCTALLGANIRVESQVLPTAKVSLC